MPTRGAHGFPDMFEVAVDFLFRNPDRGGQIPRGTFSPFECRDDRPPDGVMHGRRYRRYFWRWFHARDLSVLHGGAAQNATKQGKIVFDIRLRRPASSALLYHRILCRSRISKHIEKHDHRMQGPPSLTVNNSLLQSKYATTVPVMFHRIRVSDLCRLCKG